MDIVVEIFLSQGPGFTTP